jgi:hypothetical protein
MQSTTIKVRNSRSISDFISPPWRSVATSLTILLARGQSRSLIPTRILGRYLQNCGQFLVRSEEVAGLRPVNGLTVPTFQLRLIEAQRLFSTVCSPLSRS